MSYGVLPNFFIIGAAKSGTTSLAFYLMQHPLVYIPREKEPHFFDSVEMFTAGYGKYSRRFYSDVLSEPMIGDATPSYLAKYDVVLPRLRDYPRSSSLKFVVLLRDPVERAWSHYLHNRRNFYEQLTFEEALREEPARLEADPEAWFDYFNAGLYGQQLDAWLQQYSREQFLILDFDEFRQNADACVRSVFRFLGVQDQDVALDLSVKNAKLLPRFPVLMRITATPFPYRRQIRRLIPYYWRRRMLLYLRRKALGSESKARVPPQELPRSTREYLRAKYVDDIERLEDLLHRSYQHWK